ncbi:hypothetical protein TVAG_269190 [Trichomonas vaginalis G3]|uniref:Uncharacterized protein n=1 Tax=Trichomonas vaginalis (strain ATCC PRA-98 / G3) TaxID=412133 RepID=A2EG32_TRIV3|nr:hypothetical protein TVAG_269190 [Trichomonas vaginalis G3]|eukprot:XP_001320616.1 hypothetical protein [Trichomonas vaginalis G3]
MSTGDTNCACQSAEQSIKQQAETWRSDPIWGGWSSYQGCDLDKEGTVKIPESEYRQFVAWKDSF